MVLLQSYIQRKLSVGESTRTMKHKIQRRVLVGDLCAQRVYEHHSTGFSESQIGSYGHNNLDQWNNKFNFLPQWHVSSRCGDRNTDTQVLNSVSPLCCKWIKSLKKKKISLVFFLAYTFVVSFRPVKRLPSHFIYSRFWGYQTLAQLCKSNLESLDIRQGLQSYLFDQQRYCHQLW